MFHLVVFMLSKSVCVCCRYGGELLPKLVPNLSALSTNLENLEWLIKLNATVGDLVNYRIQIVTVLF